MKDSVRTTSEFNISRNGMRSFKIIWKGPVEEAPCKQGCPAGVDIPRYIRLISEGKFEDALAVIKEKIPFPGVVGRVCPHPCEIKCWRSEIDEPIAVNALKRCAADNMICAISNRWSGNKSTGKGVAIVGSGPAGLTAAYYLAKVGGHSATVFEASPKPGGMMRDGIPDYRLPKDILEAEIEAIQNVGVDIKTNTDIKSIDKLFEEGYDAVFLAMGAKRSLKMGIEGEDLTGVLDGLSFLREVNSGKKFNLGTKVAVIGGGNLAVDSARTALRLGSKEVVIAYRRSKEEMPASFAEVEDAIFEGVKMCFLTVPESINKTNGKLKLNCMRVELGAPDASGRRRPIPIQGSKFSMDLDSIISAIGYVPDVPKNFNLRVNGENTLQVNPDTLATNREGVFAGGDVVSGPTSVILAIAAGRKAAASIDKYLGGSGVISEDLAFWRIPASTTWEESILNIPRNKMPLLDDQKRNSSFGEVELGFTKEMAMIEAKRCIKCGQRIQIRVNVDLCRNCSTCQMVCSLTYQGVFNPANSKIVIEADKIGYKDNCVGGCSLCIDYCPYGVLERLG